MSSDNSVDRENSPQSGDSAIVNSTYGYVVATAGFIIWMLGWGTNSTFSVFLKPVLIEFGWSRAETVLAYSAAIIVMAPLAVFMGWLTDRLGPRIVVALFGSCLGICYLLMSQVTAIWQFQINYGLVGAIGMSTITIPVMATLGRCFIRKRGLMIGIVQSGIGIGGLIFAPLAGWLIMAYGWRFAYIVMGTITFVGIIISGLFLERHARGIRQLPEETYRLIEPNTDKQNREIRPSRQDANLSFKEVISESRFWLIAGIFFSFGFCRSTFFAHIAAYVQDLGFSLSDGANVLAAITVSSIIGRIGMGRVSDLIGNRPTLILSFAATTFILIWGLVTRDLWGLYLFALIFGFGWGAQAVLRFAVTSEVFAPVSLGLVMGILGLAEAGAGAFGSYFAGYIFDATGSYLPAFWVGIAVSIIGIILASLLRQTTGKE